MSQSTPATAELMIFSGRPNPQWSLSANQTQELLQLVEHAALGNTVNFPDGLGYNGYTVQLHDGRSPVTSLRVGKGVIEVVSTNQTTYRLDANRQVERWLLTSAQPHLEKEVYELVAKEMNRE